VLFLIRGFTALGCAVVGYFFLMHQVGVKVPQVLGLNRFSFSKVGCGALGITAIIFAPAYFLSWVNGMICLLFKIEASAQPLIFEFLKMTEAKSILSFIGLAVIAAPVTEEILFRGLLYPILRDRWGMKWAVGVSAVLFAFAHVHAPTFLPLMFLGVMLALAYEYSGGLLLSIFIHATFNLFTVLNLLLLKPYLLK
jgi:membrane protease YdiL (CAAX protease family)